MNYLTIERGGKEEIVAVVADDIISDYFKRELKAHDTIIRTRTLFQLTKMGLEIPVGLKWIMESDKKFQDRALAELTAFCEPEGK